MADSQIALVYRRDWALSREQICRRSGDTLWSKGPRLSEP